jgi:tetratricopeptide (TPR) repeat protein
MPRARLLALLLVAACGTGRTSQWEAPVPVPAEHAEPGAALAAEAEAAWARRGDKLKLEQAILQWEAALAQKPDDVAILGHLSRACYLLSDGFLRRPEDKAAYLSNMEKGTGYGERGLAASSPAFRAKVKDGEKVEEAIRLVGREGLEPMYWYVVNLGKWARAKGLAALLGNKDRAKGVMTRALELDETFFHGAPHRYFGAYWSLLPVGRDLDKSKQHFERSLAIAPNYAGTKVLMAETYAVKKQDKALFDRLLGEVLAMPDDAIPGLEPETRIEKDKARELQAKANDLF